MLPCINGAGLQSGQPAWLAHWRARRARSEGATALCTAVVAVRRPCRWQRLPWHASRHARLAGRRSDVCFVSVATCGRSNGIAQTACQLSLQATRGDCGATHSASSVRTERVSRRVGKSGSKTHPTTEHASEPRHKQCRRVHRALPDMLHLDGATRCATTVSLAKTSLARVAARPLGWTAIGRVLRQRCDVRPFEWHRADCLSAILAGNARRLWCYALCFERADGTSQSARRQKWFEDTPDDRARKRAAAQAVPACTSCSTRHVAFGRRDTLAGFASVDSYHNLRLAREGGARVTPESGRGRLS